MSLFADSTGRRWCVEIDAAAMMRIQRELGLDPREQIDLHLLLSATNPARAAAVLFAIVQPFASAAGIPADDFKAAVANPEILAQASEAVADALSQPIEVEQPTPRRSPFRNL